MSTFVYRGPFFFWLSILLFLAVFLAVKSSKGSTTDNQELRNLVESSPRKIRREKRKQAHELTQQTRLGVSKQIYCAQGPLRRMVDMIASSSNLRVVSKKPHLRVVETFYEAKGIVQHELYYTMPDGTEVIYDEAGKLVCRNKKPIAAEFDLSKLQPKQHFRYFEASEAIYDFHTNQLLAHSVKFWTFTADGHELVEDPFLHTPEAVGEALRMTFYVGGSDTKNEFSAEFLKVQFTPEGGI